MDFAHSTFFHAQKYDFRFDTLEKFGTRFLGFRLVTKFNRAPTFFGTRSSIPFWFQFIHAFSLMETWGHLKEIWFPLRETWVHLREIWFPLKEAWIHLKETWFLLKETRSHLTVSAGSLPVPEPMAVASALVFLWKASIFGTSNFAMDSNPFFTFFQIRDFSRLKKKRLKTSAIYFRCTWTVTKFNIFWGRCFLSVSFPWIGYRVFQPWHVIRRVNAQPMTRERVRSLHESHHDKVPPGMRIKARPKLLGRVPTRIFA